MSDTFHWVIPPDISVELPLIFAYYDDETEVEEPLDLTGWTAKFTLRARDEQTDALELTSSPHLGLVITPLTGTVTVTITLEQAAALSPDRAATPPRAGRYAAKLVLKPSSGDFGISKTGYVEFEAWP
jgi:hypothetical protein